LARKKVSSYKKRDGVSPNFRASTGKITDGMWKTEGDKMERTSFITVARLERSFVPLKLL